MIAIDGQELGETDFIVDQATQMISVDIQTLTRGTIIDYSLIGFFSVDLAY